MMLAILGIADNWIFAAIALSVLITLICMIYGLLKWNTGDNAPATNETILWVREEDRIDDEF